MREVARRPLSDHDRFFRIEPAHFLIGPINQRGNICPRLVLKLLAINTQAEPIDIIWTGIIRGCKVPRVERIGIVVGMKHPLDVCRAASADTIDYMTVSSLEILRPFPIAALRYPFIASVINAGPREPVA